MLTIETDANEGSRSTCDRGPLLWLVLWAPCVSKRYFRLGLDALVGPVQNIFFLTIHCFNSFVQSGDSHLETGGPARQPAQVAGRWGHI